MDFNAVSQFFVNNKEWLGVVFGSGVLIAAGKFGFWVWQQRRKRFLPLDTFPFEIFKPKAENIVQQLMRETQDDVLADHNIPYQQRVSGKDVTRILQQKLEKNRWLLVWGRSGLGKTREVAELAEYLNQRGWTVLRFKAQGWLDAPNEPPEDKLGNDRRLLFVFDDLHQRMYEGRSRKSPKADDPIQPLTVPLQERFLRTIEAYERFFGEEQVWVVAIARNEREGQLPGKPSEYEKLEWEKYYNSLWRRFDTYDMPEPENEAIIRLFEDTVPKTSHIHANANEYPILARRNDRTFKNVVLNLRKCEDYRLPLTQQNYQDTLKGSWEDRYTKAIQKHRAAACIYDAIELLVTVEVQLKPFVVEATARLLAGGNAWQRLKRRYEIYRALEYLIQAEEILEPRDGQIEAKKRKAVDVGEVVPHLTRLLLQLARQRPQEMWFSLRNFAFEIYKLGFLTQAIDCLDTALVIANAYENLISHSEIDSELAEWLSFFFYLTYGVRGNALTDLERYDRALASYDKALKFKPDDDVTWNNRGTSLSNLGRLEEAIASYDKALEFKPDYDAAWYNRGNSLSNLGREEEAIASYDKALEFKPDNDAAWNNRGTSLSNLGREEEAIASYDKALEFKPDYDAAWYNRGNSLSNLGREEEAIASYDKALEFKPDDDVTWYNRGNSLSNLGREEEAIASYDKALEFKPDDDAAWYNRGTSLSNLGREEEAIASYDKALEFKPDYDAAWYNRGNSLSNLGRLEEAIASYDKALEFSPYIYQAWWSRGNSFIQVGQWAAAAESLQGALQIEPNNPAAWHSLGVAQIQLRQFDPAIEALDKALELAPEFASASYNKACCYALQSQIELAIEQLQQAISLDLECREDAKTDSDFDNIRNDDQFQALLNQNE